jgi:hypothetical protein
MSEDGRGFRPTISGRPQFAARVRADPTGEVWFTAGQAWAFDSDDGPAYRIHLTMTPVNWDGEVLLMPLLDQEETDAQD